MALSLPAGTYILNNGPKKKGKGGRFTLGQHSTIKKILLSTHPGISFTEKPEKADFVIVPEGVREPGSKLKRRNPSLSDSRNVFSMDRIKHALAYPKMKPSLQYEVKDGTTGQIIKSVQVPVNLEPTDANNQSLIYKIDEQKYIKVDFPFYPVIRTRANVQPTVQPPVQSPMVQSPAVRTNAIESKINELNGLLLEIDQAPPEQQSPEKDVVNEQPQPQPALTEIEQTNFNTTFDAYKKSIEYLKTTMHNIKSNYNLEENNLNDDVINDKESPDTNSIQFTMFLKRLRDVYQSIDTLFYVLEDKQMLESMRPTVEGTVTNPQNIDEIFSESVQLGEYKTDKKQFFRKLIAEQKRLELMYVYIMNLNKDWREKILVDIRDSLIGLECKKESRVCNGQDKPQAVDEMLYSLFNISCKISDNIKSKVGTYSTVCNFFEGVAGSANDFHNFLFNQGAKKSLENLFPHDVSTDTFCSNMFKTMNDAVFMMNQETKSEELRIQPQKVSFMRFLQFLQKVGVKDQESDPDGKTMGEVYNAYVKFLLENTTRASNFANLNSLISSKVADDDQKCVWLAMYLLSLYLVMGNLCSGSNGYFGFWKSGVGNFSKEKIEKLLRTPIVDQPPTPPYQA